MKQSVLAVFPLANDVVTKGDNWVCIGPNAKCRIDDMVRLTRNGYANEEKVMVFAAGSDAAHSTGPTLAALGLDYFLSQYKHRGYTYIENEQESDVYGTDPEIVWGVQKVLERYPAASYELRFLFGTQRRHMARVEKIVKRRFHTLRAQYVVTGQTKEIPWWREGVSHAKLMLGDGWLAQRVQQLRRAFPDRFDKA